MNSKTFLGSSKQATLGTSLRKAQEQNWSGTIADWKIEMTIVSFEIRCMRNERELSGPSCSGEGLVTIKDLTRWI
jgi:hypothetical protein